jgi:hypothetical protein
MGETLSFKEKLKTIQFGVSTQNPGSRKNYYDKDSVEQVFGGAEAQNDYLETMEGIPLKWDGPVPYRKDKAGDYVRADEKDMNRIMYGTNRPKKASD